MFCLLQMEALHSFGWQDVTYKRFVAPTIVTCSCGWILDICTRSSVRTFFVEESSFFSLEPPMLGVECDHFQSFHVEITIQRQRLSKKTYLSISSKKITHGADFFACSNSILIFFSLSPTNDFFSHTTYWISSSRKFYTYQTTYSTNLSLLRTTTCN